VTTKSQAVAFDKTDSEIKSKKSKRGGRRPGSGRKPGAPNKVTRDLKEALLNAFEKAGGSRYLARLAKDDPRTFCALLGKIIPMTIGGDPDNPVQVQVERIELVVVDPKNPPANPTG
jgi:hypothetical protein